MEYSGHHLFQIYVKWSEVRRRGIPKEEFITSGVGKKKVVSTLIIRGNPQYPFDVPQVAFETSIDWDWGGRKYKTSYDFYRVLPTLLPKEFCEFLINNEDAINDLYNHQELYDYHYKILKATR